MINSSMCSGNTICMLSNTEKTDQDSSTGNMVGVNFKIKVWEFGNKLYKLDYIIY